MKSILYIYKYNIYRGVKQPKDGTVKSVLKRLLLKLEREGQLENWKNKAPVVDIPITQVIALAAEIFLIEE